jgi:hypothetical protein
MPLTSRSHDWSANQRFKNTFSFSCKTVAGLLGPLRLILTDCLVHRDRVTFGCGAQIQGTHNRDSRVSQSMNTHTPQRAASSDPHVRAHSSRVRHWKSALPQSCKFYPETDEVRRRLSSQNYHALHRSTEEIICVLYHNEDAFLVPTPPVALSSINSKI